ncbi:MAG: TIR domain-containing protein [Thermomicrobiales bacterium]
MLDTEDTPEALGRMIEQAREFEPVARRIQDHEPSNAPDEDVEQFYRDYLEWYAECLALLPEDLNGKFIKEFEGAGAILGQKIQRFFTDPKKRHFMWRDEPHDPDNPFSPTFFQYPIDRYFLAPLRQQQALLLQAAKRRSATREAGLQTKTLSSRGDTKEQLASMTVFIGHGRSLVYKYVESFLDKRLHLNPLTYESNPRSGITNVDVLKDCLNRTDFAILVLTGEDETAEGKSRARQNVVHEIGLFQGRLGFERVALLRQSGVEEFSNLAGLQELRFEGEMVSSTFEDLRAVLEREKLIADS